MMNIREYLSTNPRIHKFSVAPTFWGKVKFECIKALFKTLPFGGRLYVDAPQNLNFYFELLFSYLKKEFGMHVGNTISVLGIGSKGYKGNVLVEVDIDGKKEVIKGHGSSFESQDEALSKAVGEFLERYSSAVPSPDDAVLIRSGEVEHFLRNTVHVRQFHSYSKEQIAANSRLSFRSTGKMKLLPMEHLMSGKKVWYPLQQIFWHQNALQRKEGFFSYATTSGCAGGFTVEEATLFAFYELIERDAFMCHWLTKSSPKKVVLEKGVFPAYDDFSTLIDVSGFEVHILDTTTNTGIPSALCVVRGKDGVQLCVAGGARATLMEAIEVAFGEMMSCVALLRSEQKFSLPPTYVPFTTTGIHRDERIRLWAHAQDTSAAHFLLDGETVAIHHANVHEYRSAVSVEKKDELKHCLSMLARAGESYSHVYRYLFRSPRVEALGFFVVRVIIPMLYPLYLSENHAFTESARLCDFARWKHGTEQFEINTTVHPFP